MNTIPNEYEVALRASWCHLLEWIKVGRFAPENEEDIQCFLYHGIVQYLGTAIGVRAKSTAGKPAKIAFQNGKRLMGNTHFPDLALGKNAEEPEVVVEIKFRAGGRRSFFDACKADLVKLEAKHSQRRRFFILVDAHPDFVFMDEHQYKELAALAPDCTVLHFPAAFNISPLKESARRAVATMRASGLDFSALGINNAAKAIKGKS